MITICFLPYYTLYIYTIYCSPFVSYLTNDCRHLRAYQKYVGHVGDGENWLSPSQARRDEGHNCIGGNHDKFTATASEVVVQIAQKQVQAEPDG